jgi:hypothetical protein
VPAKTIGAAEPLNGNVEDKQRVSRVFLDSSGGEHSVENLQPALQTALLGDSELQCCQSDPFLQPECIEIIVLYYYYVFFDFHIFRAFSSRSKACRFFVNCSKVCHFQCFHV